METVQPGDRSVTISVKVTPEEQQVIRLAAAKRNLNISRYIRVIILPKAEREAAA